MASVGSPLASAAAVGGVFSVADAFARAPFRTCCGAIVGSCPEDYWATLYARFRPPERTLDRALSGAALELSGIWDMTLPFADAVSLARLSHVSHEVSWLFMGPSTAAALRRMLGCRSLEGSVPAMCRLGGACDDLPCSFLTRWTGQADAVEVGRLLRMRQRFPQARMYLWETGFPIELESKLCAPAAFVVSSPAAELQIGTVKLRLSLRLMCVCDPFFDPARPLRGLLVRLEAQVDSGPTLWAGGAPGRDGHSLCGEGHRWCCVCESAEAAGVQLFCSLRESWLRPAMRHPYMLATYERPHLHHCEHLDGEVVGKLLSEPLRLCLAIYRTEDDFAPDEPESLD